MTPTERRRCLDLIGWSQRALADILGINDSTVRRWFRDGDTPVEVDEWLAKVAKFHEQNPPPEHQITRTHDRVV
jgi:transcriptional regulator with XRE-family HTH domain